MNSGCYRLYIEVGKDISFKAGKLGKISLPEGLYVYTGSAMKNLEQRIERHKRKKKKLKWHIDYLLSDKDARIIKVESFPSEIREECIKNLEIVNLPWSQVPVKGFGSSDCRKCPAHLVGIKA